MKSARSPEHPDCHVGGVGHSDEGISAPASSMLMSAVREGAQQEQEEDRDALTGHRYW